MVLPIDRELHELSDQVDNIDRDVSLKKLDKVGGCKPAEGSIVNLP